MRFIGVMFASALAISMPTNAFAQTSPSPTVVSTKDCTKLAQSHGSGQGCSNCIGSHGCDTKYSACIIGKQDNPRAMEGCSRSFDARQKKAESACKSMCNRPSG